MKKSTFLIVGKHAVLEALKNPNRKIERVFLTEDAQKKLNKENQNLNLFKNIYVFYKSKKELDNLCGRDETAHQGLVAEVEQLEDITLKEFILENKKKNINLIALEEVTDPRNIGSIIRSAVAFNIDGIIVKERSYPSKSKLAVTAISPFRPRRWSGKIVSNKSVVKIKNLNPQKRPLALVADNIEKRNIKNLNVKNFKKIKIVLLYDGSANLNNKIIKEQRKK